MVERIFEKGSFKSRVEGRRSYGGMRVTNIGSYLRLLVSADIQGTLQPGNANFNVCTHSKI